MYHKKGKIQFGGIIKNNEVIMFHEGLDLDQL